jgi:NadR type nicotinamide-nucleotide adenylyltransferase
MQAVKTILILGGESTGKSTLAEVLAAHYQTVWVPEYARTYLDNLPGDYTLADLSEIAIGQLSLEEILLPTASKFLFCDTGIDVICWWSAQRFGLIDEALLNARSAPHYDAVLVTAPDLEWQPDPQREHPNPTDRERFFNHFVGVAEKSGKPFVIIRGQGDDRLHSAIAFLNEQFSEHDLN